MCVLLKNLCSVLFVDFLPAHQHLAHFLPVRFGFQNLRFRSVLTDPVKKLPVMVEGHFEEEAAVFQVGHPRFYKQFFLLDVPRHFRRKADLEADQAVSPFDGPGMLQIGLDIEMILVKSLFQNVDRFKAADA